MAGAFAPMLSKGGPLPIGDRWLYEPKYDGFHLQVGTHSEGVWAEIGRNSVRWDGAPYITEAVNAAVPQDTILDGELFSDLGWKHTARVVKRTQGNTPYHKPRQGDPALTFIVFDVLVWAGEDMRGKPFEQRRAVLEEHLSGVEAPMRLTPIHDPVTDGLSADEFFLKCVDAGFEGVMAKKRTGRYRCGRRSSDQIKVKVQNTVDVVVVEIYDSNKSDSWLAKEKLPGKLGFAYWDEEAGEVGPEIGRVGTGFDKREREDIRDNPDDWLDHVIEVGHMTVATEGRYRHPAFVRRRDDRKPESAVRQDETPDEPRVAGAAEPPKKERKKKEDPIDKEGYIDSAARSASGNKRAFGQMKDEKLLGIAAEMVGSEDAEGIGWVMEEMRNRPHLSEPKETK